MAIVKIKKTYEKRYQPVKVLFLSQQDFKIFKIQDFKILIRIRTPNRGIDLTVTHIHETITTQKKTLKRASKKTRIGRQSKTNEM